MNQLLDANDQSVKIDSLGVLGGMVHGGTLEKTVKMTEPRPYLYIVETWI